MRLHDTPLTQVVPWAILSRRARRGPTRALCESVDLGARTSRGAVFGRSTAALGTGGADQTGAKPGFMAADTSIAEENMADPDKPSEALDHQCVTVCEGDGDSSSCFPGSIVWMAHDIRQVAEVAHSGVE